MPPIAKPGSGEGARIAPACYRPIDILSIASEFETPSPLAFERLLDLIEKGEDRRWK